MTAVDARVDRLREAAREAGLDALVVTSPASIFYLTGFDGLQFERLFAIAVPVRGGGALIVPRLDEEAAGRAPTGLERIGYDAASDGFPELIGALDGARVVGVEEEHLAFGRGRRLESEGLELSAAGELVMEQRITKDREELDRIRTACTVIAAEMERMFAELRVVDTERAVNARVAYRLTEAGATEAHPHILFGPSASNPHASPGERALAPGDVICADVAARVNGYWGDLTRCGTAGPPQDWARGAWEVVREAQAATIAACRAGTPARDVDAVQRAIVEGAGELGRCLHGAGHAIGAEVHEPPFLVPRTAAPLEPGTVLTIEPGIYATGIGGIRLEDDVAVTDGEPELLSSLPLELREVPSQP
jgi:Xaa-Pro dipeptidase